MVAQLQDARQTAGTDSTVSSKLQDMFAFQTNTSIAAAAVTPAPNNGQLAAAP
jgi:hypothetical protein